MAKHTPLPLGLYAQLMRLNRPIGIYLVMWPTLWSLWLAAKGAPSIKNIVIFVLGCILMRSAGCVINDYADRHFDRQVRRTQDRPLATGAVSTFEALGLFGILIFLAFVLVLLTNPLTVKLACVGLLLAVIYPFMKRYTHMPQVVLGMAFACAIPMAFAAEINQLPQEVWLIFTAVVLWTVCYDTFYAMVDREDDLKIGVKSTAVLLGEMDRVMTGFLQGFTLLCLVLLGRQLKLSWIYFLALIGVLLLFGYQQYLIRDREAKGCFAAFLNNNWVGMLVFMGIVGHYALYPVSES